ncbi:phage head-tail connector protein [Roseococcus sp. YIM B11640]|uniref:phage head-tail connector protein n=1 Tax=Roseococcus sp. YIM B11640 TaxID=3133973 RepID=UPI003C7B8103
MAYQSHSLTVVAPAASKLLCTLDDVKVELGLSGSADDAALTARIGQASDAIAASCDRVFARETVQETFRGLSCQGPLRLERQPVASIVSVAVDGQAFSAGDYEVDADGRLWRLSGDALAGWAGSKVVVTYAGGYLLPEDASPTLPLELRRACIDRVVRGWSSVGRDPWIRSESTEGVDSISFFDPDKLSAEDDGVFAKYRRVLV